MQTKGYELCDAARFVPQCSIIRTQWLLDYHTLGHGFAANCRTIAARFLAAVAILPQHFLAAATVCRSAAQHVFAVLQLVRRSNQAPGGQNWPGSAGPQAPRAKFGKFAYGSGKISGFDTHTTQNGAGAFGRPKEKSP
jgi:uncharacterized membrane protein YgcG